MTYAQIASALGLSTAMVAWRYVQDALADIPKEVAAEVKQIEIEDCRADILRINERLAVRGEKMTTTDLAKALGAKAKLREQLARYLGLYAPVRTELTGKDGAPLQLTQIDIEAMTDEQLKRVISDARRAGRSSGPGARAPEETPGEDRQAH